VIETDAALVEVVGSAVGEWRVELLERFFDLATPRPVRLR
jgi:hypothetical protein